MQVVVSTSLQTWNSRFTPAPATEPAWPEILTISVAAWLIVRSLGLFNLHEKPLGFRGVGVRVGDGGRQQICRRARVAVFIFLDAAETLINRQANLVGLLAVDHYRFHPSGHVGLGGIGATRADHVDHIRAANSLFVLQW